jgi:hypothetical protein
MPNENRRVPNGLASCKKSNDIAVAQAIDDFVSAGFAIIDREVKSCPLLYLLSGEIFMLGNDYITRIW